MQSPGATGTLAQEIPQLIVKRVEVMLQRLHHLYAVKDARVVRAQHHDRQSLDDGRQLLLELRKRLGRTDAAQPGCRVTEKAHRPRPISTRLRDQALEFRDPVTNRVLDRHEDEKPRFDRRRHVDLLALERAKVLISKDARGVEQARLVGEQALAQKGQAKVQPSRVRSIEAGEMAA